MGYGPSVHAANRGAGHGLNGMPASSLMSVLGILLLLQLKHSVFDGPLQLRWMLRDKGYYGKPGGLAHAGLHGIGTIVAFVLCSHDPAVALLLGAVDAAVHYHVDFAKESLVRARKWTPEKPQFWWALTTDQFLHQLTYLALTAAALTNLSPSIWS